MKDAPGLEYLAPLVPGTTPAQLDRGEERAHRLTHTIVLDAPCAALGRAVPILVTVDLYIYYTLMAGGR